MIPILQIRNQTLWEVKKTCWWLSAKESIANAGDTGSIPGPGRSHIPRSYKACVPQLLSLCSRSGEPQLLSPHATVTEALAP